MRGVTKRCRLSWLTNSALVQIWAQIGRGGGGCAVSANKYSCAHGGQINFGDLTQYLTYGSSRPIPFGQSWVRGSFTPKTYIQIPGRNVSLWVSFLPPALFWLCCFFNTTEAIIMSSQSKTVNHICKQLWLFNSLLHRHTWTCKVYANIWDYFLEQMYLQL